MFVLECKVKEDPQTVKKLKISTLNVYLGLPSGFFFENIPSLYLPNTKLLDLKL